MIISNRGLFRKLFSFYILIISYIPKRGHHNVIIIIIIIIIIIEGHTSYNVRQKNIFINT